MHTLRALLRALIPGCAALLLALPAAAKMKVVATLPDLGAVAQAVGGDLVEITTLAPPNQDPHYVDPRPSLILPLSKADLLIINGLQLEQSWLQPLLSASRNAELQPGGQGLLDASTFVQRLQVPQGAIDRAMGDIHPGGNPHYSHDPRQMARVALAIADRMSRLDPEHAAQYAAQGKQLAAALEAYAAEARTRFAALPAAKRRVITYHRSLVYLTDWLQLEDMIQIEPRPGIPPNPGHVAKVLQTMKGAGVKVILQEEFYPRKSSDTLARLVKGQVVMLPGGTQIAKGQTYLARIKATTEAIYAALSR